MREPPTTKEITNEIERLIELRSLIPPMTAFGNNNEEAINAEIVVLKRLLDENDIDRIWENNQYVYDYAIAAFYWYTGEELDPEFTSPADEWEELVNLTEKRRRKCLT